MHWLLYLCFLIGTGGASWGSPHSSVRLPDSHTITGLVQDVDGSWWAGNDGRQFQGDRFRPGIVHLTADFRTISEFKTPGNATLQGVALVGQEVWAAHAPSQSVIKYTRDGRRLGSIKVRAKPNGLAFDGTHMIVSFEGDRAVEWYRRDGSFVRRVALPVEPDHLAWSGGKLWYSTGNNGRPGCVLAVNGGGYCSVHANAIEGFGFVGDRLVIANDGYFHDQRPKKNQILIYRR